MKNAVRRVMTILNVTPDSFYAGSRTFDREAIAARVKAAVAEGADIMDIGGYSSRPDAEDVSAQEELRRVTTGVETVRELFPDLPVSIDTFRSSVAEKILKRYGNITVNDITSGEADSRMADVAAHYGAPFIAMHMRGTPKTMQRLASYGNVVEEVREYLGRRADFLLSRGVRDIILDPGFGFAKTAGQNFQLLAGMDRIADLGYPVLAGISRKSFIYRTLGITPDEALPATTALHWECLRRGATILRVHDTLSARQTIELYEKTEEYGKEHD